MADEKGMGAKQKALEINLDTSIYGSFAEIGAGQEVAAMFFKAGGASGTIAKTMSAYDMTFSNAIYGEETGTRYVVESRLIKMFSREYELLEERLGEKRGEHTKFFALANTVATINYTKTIDGHGWIGMRFQLNPQTPPNDVVMHVIMHEPDALLQQQAIGILGVNLLYGCYHYYKNPEKLLISLMDGLSRDRVDVDMFRLTGPDFTDIDNRLISLLLVKNGLADAAMFGPDGNVLQASEVFYKKPALVLRGRFRPVTHVNMNMLDCGKRLFEQDDAVALEKDKIVTVAELTLHDIKAGEEHIDEKDFLDRVDILGSLGLTVLISNYHQYHKLVAYLSKVTRKHIGIILGINNLQWIFDEGYYKDLKGGILESFSVLFSKNIKLYVYPSKKRGSDEFLSCKNFTLPPHLISLFHYLVANDKVHDIEDSDQTIAHIISDNVLRMIKQQESGWESMVPDVVANKIKEKQLFDYLPAE